MWQMCWPLIASWLFTRWSMDSYFNRTSVFSQSPHYFTTLELLNRNLRNLSWHYRVVANHWTRQLELKFYVHHSSVYLVVGHSILIYREGLEWIEYFRELLGDPPLEISPNYFNLVFVQRSLQWQGRRSQSYTQIVKTFVNSGFQSQQIWGKRT